MTSSSTDTSTLLFLCLFIIYSATTGFCFVRIIKLHKFDPRWRKAQVFYVLVLIQVALRSVCMLVLSSQLSDLSSTGMYLLISTPDSLFLITYIILIWQLTSLFNYAHIANQSKQTFISEISNRPKINKLGWLTLFCVVVFAIVQSLLYFILVLEKISSSTIVLELD